MIPCLKTLVKRLLVGTLWVYQAAVSPFLPPACRFYPTCSHYAIEAIERRGVLTGLWLATRRLLRCHPWHPGGYDPVPEAQHRRVAAQAHTPWIHSTP